MSREGDREIPVTVVSINVEQERLPTNDGQESSVSSEPAAEKVEQVQPAKVHTATVIRLAREVKPESISAVPETPIPQQPNTVGGLGGGGGNLPPPPPPSSPTGGAPPPPREPQRPRQSFPWRRVGHYALFASHLCWTILRGYHMTTNEHHRRMLVIGHWSGPLYALIVATGIPIVGFISPTLEHRYLISTGFLFVGILYWFTETSQITAQMKLEGLLDIDATERQRRRMMLPYWGVAVAFVLWIIARVARVPGYELHYGIVEFSILVFTAVNASGCINVVYPLLSEFLQATATQKRFEKEGH